MDDYEFGNKDSETNSFYWNAKFLIPWLHHPGLDKYGENFPKHTASFLNRMHKMADDCLIVIDIREDPIQESSK